MPLNCADKYIENDVCISLEEEYCEGNNKMKGI